MRTFVRVPRPRLTVPGRGSGLATMPDEDLVLFVRQSSCVSQSVDRVRPKFHHWRRRLLTLGITKIRPLLDGPGSPEEEQARSLLTLFMLQAASPRNQSIEHALRDLTGIRHAS
jgi:hypothetical protein